ncbi:MAG: bacteriohemerythrin, partial [Gammaproteobacteria bacterium]
MSLLEWRPEFELGRADMDDTHKEFVELVNAVDTASKEEFCDRFNALVLHTRKHFEAENELMISSGFFATTEHVGEHHRVMGQLDYFNKHVHLGRHEMGRELL